VAGWPWEDSICLYLCHSDGY